MMPHMVGRPNEDVIWDTGSQINTISVDTVNRLNPKPKIRPCEELEIRCADGNTLPYFSYVAVLVDLPFMKSSPVVNHFWLYQ